MKIRKIYVEGAVVLAGRILIIQEQDGERGVVCLDSTGISDGK